MTASQKVLFMAVIPEVRNRESILFKKLHALGFPPFLLGEPAGAGAGMTTFYEFINNTLYRNRSSVPGRSFGTFLQDSFD